MNEIFMHPGNEKGLRSTSKEIKRHNELLEPRDSIITIHKQIMLGGLAYLERRNEIVIAGSEGNISVLNANTMERVSSFKAHDSNIVRLFPILGKEFAIDCKYRWNNIGMGLSTEMEEAIFI